MKFRLRTKEEKLAYLKRPENLLSFGFLVGFVVGMVVMGLTHGWWM